MPEEVVTPRRRSQRLSTGLVALGSGAILAVYAAGLARTQAATDQLARQAPPPLVATSSRGGPTPTAIALVARKPPTSPPTSTTAARSPQPTAIVPTATPTVAVTVAPLRDGTYIGNGTSRHGGMTVTVVIAQSQIVSAEVTDCQMRYPCSKVAGLPAQVVARQSAAVDAVSGATESIRAYRGALLGALAQAH